MLTLEAKRARILQEMRQARRQTLPVREPIRTEKDPVTPEPIAIAGLAGYLPQSMSIRQFWRALDRDQTLIEEIPGSRFSWREIYDPDGENQDRSRTKWGGFIPDIRGFDPEFFHISPAEAELMDPRQRLLLMAAYHCLEDAGHAPASLKGQAVGVFIGVEENEYLQNIMESGVPLTRDFGHAAGMVANRLSYFFDLRGPSEFVNTMCSGAAVALHRAVCALRSGEINGAIVGAANLLLRPDLFISLSNMGQLCPTRVSHSFGRDADGYHRAEGVACVYLKTLSRAKADGDAIYALIRHSAVNYNGRGGMSIAAPHTPAHAELIRKCYAEAGVDVRRINYIETQGMGNPVADIAEWNACNRALQMLAREQGVALEPGSCRISTLKPMMGHMHSASALGALFKIIRSLETGTIHKIAGFSGLNPDLVSEDQSCIPADRTETWPRDDQSRLAGLHAYGSGGNNAHLLIEEYERQPDNEDRKGPFLVVLSARDESRLRRIVSNLRHHLVDLPSALLPNLAYTLQIGRDAMEERIAILTADPADLMAKLTQIEKGASSIENCWRGRIDQGGNAWRSLAGDPDARGLIKTWIDKGNLQKIAEIWTGGHEMDWRMLYRSGLPRRLHLPSYPFADTPYWIPDARKDAASKPPRQAAPTSPEKSGASPEDWKPPRTAEPPVPESGPSAKDSDSDAVADFVNRLTPDKLERLFETFVSEKTTVEDPNRDQPRKRGVHEIEATIANILADTLKIGEASIKPGKPFSEYGLNSINGTRFIHLLEDALDLTIPPKWMFDYPSIRDLARIIETRAKTNQGANPHGASR